MMKQRILTLAGIALAASAATACEPPTVINDDFGVAGYARLEGTVVRANGASSANVRVYFGCGAHDPWFGSTSSSDANGALDIAVNVPGAGTLPASSTLVCEVSAPDLPVPTSIRVTTAFSRNADARPTTTFRLVEGQSSP